jgi:pimeloyl-ACP methyl ester carboxylesterase
VSSTREVTSTFAKMCRRWLLAALGEVIDTPAWRRLPSWYLVARNDEAIPPDAERHFAARMGATVVEVDSSHVPMVSRPGDVAALIERAADAVAIPAESR